MVQTGPQGFDASPDEEVSFPSPALCQQEDEDAVLIIGEVVCPGFVVRDPQENGLRLCVTAKPSDPTAKDHASSQFRIVLGLLRALRPASGELWGEWLSGLGDGPARDSSGNQYVTIRAVIEYTTSQGEIERFAKRAAKAMRQRGRLKEALGVYGRTNRDAAVYNLVFLYARDQFGGKKAAVETLGIDPEEARAFDASTSNLPGSEGGRKPGRPDPATWSLVRQRDFVADVLRRWINVKAALSPTGSSQHRGVTQR